MSTQNNSHYNNNNNDCDVNDLVVVSNLCDMMRDATLFGIECAYDSAPDPLINIQCTAADHHNTDSVIDGDHDHPMTAAAAAHRRQWQVTLHAAPRKRKLDASHVDRLFKAMTYACTGAHARLPSLTSMRQSVDDDDDDDDDDRTSPSQAIRRLRCCRMKPIRNACTGIFAYRSSPR